MEHRPTQDTQTHTHNRASSFAALLTLPFLLQKEEACGKRGGLHGSSVSQSSLTHAPTHRLDLLAGVLLQDLLELVLMCPLAPGAVHDVYI